MPCGLQLETNVVSIAVGAWYCGLLECALWTTTRDKCSQYSVGAWYCGLLECALWTTTRDKCSQYRCRCMVLWSISVCLVDYNSRQV